MARRFETRYQRKEKTWLSLAGIQLTLTTDATALGAALSFSGNSTLMRMLGEYIIAPTSATTALDGARITVAIGKISTDAFTAGAASVPDPASEPEYPWLYWMEHRFFYSGTDPESASAAASIRRSIDIHSMRKFKPGESLAYIVQYADTTGAPPLTVNLGQTRCLFAES